MVSRAEWKFVLAAVDIVRFDLFAVTASSSFILLYIALPEGLSGVWVPSLNSSTYVFLRWSARVSKTTSDSLFATASWFLVGSTVCALRLNCPMVFGGDAVGAVVGALVGEEFIMILSFCAWSFLS